MRTIEITTTQNVTIEYELCNLGERITAFILDQVIIISSILLLISLVSLALPSYLVGNVNTIIAAGIFVLYSPTCEILLNGQSLGKRALRIRIVNLTGRQPHISDFMIRWAFRVVDIWLSLGSIAAILSSTTSNGQRLGGMLSNTTVIKDRPRMTSSLQNILSIHSLENYQPEYVDVKKFSEAEMLLVKKVIDRANKHPNEAHREALDALVNKISATLQLTTVPKNKIKFLKTIIRDYIALTR